MYPAPAPPVEARQVTAWLPLLREALTRDGQFRFPLRGNSMRPTLPESCEIVVVPLPPQPPLGSLIVFLQHDTLIAHRLVRRTKAGWIAQGDGRWGPDPLLQPTQVVGLVAAAYQDGRAIWPGRLADVGAWGWVARHHLLWPVRGLVRQVRRWGDR